MCGFAAARATTSSRGCFVIPHERRRRECGMTMLLARNGRLLIIALAASRRTAHPAAARAHALPAWCQRLARLAEAEHARGEAGAAGQEGAQRGAAIRVERHLGQRMEARLGDAGARRVILRRIPD